jgi:integrase
MPKALPPGVERVGASSYRGRYYGPDGRRHSTPTYSRAEHAAWAIGEARAKMQTGGWVDPARAGVTLDQWFGLWLPTTKMRGYVREKEADRYRLHVKPYLGKMPLGKITTFTVTTWHTDMQRDGKPAATIVKAHALLKACLGPRGGAMSDNRITVNPCQLVQPPPALKKKWRLITMEEYARLLAEMPEQARCVVILAAHTGLRWSEIVGLRREDYNPLRDEITVRRGTVYHRGRLIDDDPKDREERTIPLVPLLAVALKTHVSEKAMLPAERLFTAPKGGTLRHPNFMEAVYKPAAVRAGLATWGQRDGRKHYEGVRFHDLRHSFISWLLNGGVDIHEAKELAGHASITTTQVYAHTDPDEVRSAMTRAFGAGG